jgi:hypothetical protein
MYSIVLEKSENIREMMKLMGLKMRYYWITLFVFNYTIYLIIAVITFLLCLVFQFKFATSGNPLITFLVLIIWGFTLFVRLFQFKFQSLTLFSYLQFPNLC